MHRLYSSWLLRCIQSTDSLTERSLDDTMSFEKQYIGTELLSVHQLYKETTSTSFSSNALFITAPGQSQTPR